LLLQNLTPEAKQSPDMKRTLFITGICILLFSCVNSKKLIENSKIDRIYFGKRGGFTNIPMEYVMFEKGQLYKIRNDSLFRIKRVRRKQLNEIDSLLTVSNFKELNINDPGNITYFIRVAKEDYEKEVNWSDSSGQDDLKLLYNTMLGIIKEKKKHR
jgi:hypothetical protein